MTTLGEIWKGQQDDADLLLAVVQNTIRSHLNCKEETLATIFEHEKGKAFIAAYCDMVGKLQDVTQFKPYGCATGLYEYRYNGIRVFTQSAHGLTLEKLKHIANAACDEPIRIEEDSSESGVTDLFVIRGNIELILSKKDWVLYLVDQTWGGFKDNFLQERREKVAPDVDLGAQ